MDEEELISHEIDRRNEEALRSREEEDFRLGDPREAEERGVCMNCGAEMEYNPAAPWCEDCIDEGEEEDEDE